MPGQRTVNAVAVDYDNMFWGSFSSKKSLKSSGEHPPEAVKAWHKSFYSKHHFPYALLVSALEVPFQYVRLSVWLHQPFKSDGHILQALITVA